MWIFKCLNIFFIYFFKKILEFTNLDAIITDISQFLTV